MNVNAAEAPSPVPTAPEAGRARRAPRLSGWARVLVAVYAILAIAATGRSISQAADRWVEAPIPITLSVVAGVVYVVAALALALGWRRLAWATIGFELAGVLIVGSLSVFAPGVLGIHDLADIDPFHGRLGTVWSWWGMGYLLIPLLLPILGLVYLARSRARSLGERRETEGPNADRRAAREWRG